MPLHKATYETVRRLFKAYLGHGMNRDKAIMLIAKSVGVAADDVRDIVSPDIKTKT